MIVVAMASQMAKTEFCLNIIGYYADTQSQPILFVMPTQKMAEDISKDRFSKMVRGCPSLLSKLAKGRMNQVTVKWIGGNRIGFVWSSSASQLCSHPAGVVILDERDRMQDDVEGEGDPVRLAEARTTTYPNAKIIVISTPTMLGASAIWKLFERGTQSEWQVICLECKKNFSPCLDNFQYEADDTKIKTAYLQCPHCQAKFCDDKRELLLATGQYISKNPDAEVASFWVSGICSPWRTFKQTAQKHFEAKKTGDIEQLKTCINTIFGECFVAKGESLNVNLLVQLKQPYQRGEIPVGVMTITCGCDVQKDCIYYAIRGWGKNDQSWLLDYGIIYGSTEQEETWQKLDILIRTPIGKMPIRLICVDSGYRPYFVYGFCKKYPGIIFPCKGIRHQVAPIRTSPIEIEMTGARFKTGNKLYIVDDGYFKSLLFSRIINKQWFLPAKVDEEYLIQITAEEQVLDREEGMIWKEKYRHRNHYLDAEKLNLVAASILRVDLLDSSKEFQRVRSGGIDIWQ